MHFLSIEEALSDLEKAIEFSSKYSDFKVLSLAYAQKGTILRLEGKYWISNSFIKSFISLLFYCL